VYLGAILYLNATINRSQAPRSSRLLIAVFKYDVHNLNCVGELLCSLPSHSSFLIHLQLIIECVHLSLAQRAIYYCYGALGAVQRRFVALQMETMSAIGPPSRTDASDCAFSPSAGVVTIGEFCRWCFVGMGQSGLSCLVLLRS
jgi:hypothetical protein